MTRVAVIGAGIAGLTVAEATVRLGRERGLSPVVDVFEAGPRPGGCIRTIREDGYVVECGPGAIAGGSAEARAFFRSLDLEPSWVPPAPEAKRKFIFARGRLHKAPTGVAALLCFGAIPLSSRLRVLLEPVLARRGDSPEAVHDFMVRHFGREAGTLGAGLMVRGVLGGDARKISLDAAYPRLREFERKHRSLFKAQTRERRAGRGFDVSMGSFRNGLETLVDRLAERLGESLHLNRPARALTRAAGGKGWRVEFESGDAEDFDRVVLAIPARKAADLLSGMSAPAAAALREIECAGMAVVAFAFARESFQNPPEGYGFLVAPGEPLDILGAVFESNVFPDRAPGGCVLVRCMLGGAGRDGLLGLPDAALVEAANTALERALGLRAAPVRTWVFRHPAAIPQYGLTHLQTLARLDDALRDMPGLALAGNSFRGVAVGSLIEDAASVADRTLAAPAACLLG